VSAVRAVVMGDGDGDDGAKRQIHM